MSNQKSIRIEHHFAELTDPRRREVTYPLINVVVIALCGVICGADDFVAIGGVALTNGNGKCATGSASVFSGRVVEEALAKPVAHSVNA